MMSRDEDKGWMVVKERRGRGRVDGMGGMEWVEVWMDGRGRLAGRWTGCWVLRC